MTPFVVDLATKSVVILGAAWIATLCMRGASAAARHLVWTCAVVATLVLPALAIGLPRIAVPVPAPERARFIELASPTVSGAHVSIDPKPAIVETLPTTPSATAHADLSPAVIAVDRANAARMSLTWQMQALILWLAGFIAVFVPIIIARIRLAFIARSARRVESGPVAEVVATVVALYGISRPVRLLETDGAAMPMTWGLRSPVLMVPAAAAEWPRWKVRNVVMHELAHADRFDCLTQLIAQVACAVYWFNPLAWVAARHMRVERELACDDRVIAAGSRPSEYADQLLDVARSLHPVGATAHAAIAMARPSQLSGRVVAVLDASRPRGGVSRRFRSFTGIAAALFIVPLAALAPSASASVKSVENPSVVADEAAPPIVTAPRASETALATTSAPASAPVTNGVPSLSSALIDKTLPFIKAMQAPSGLVSIAMPDAAPAARQSSLLCWQRRGDSEKGSTSINISDDDSRSSRRSMRVKFENAGCRMEMEIRGRFTLRPDLTDLATLESGGSFWMEERDGGTTRRVEIRSDGSGLEHTYYVNGRRSEFTTEAKNWLRDALLALERRTAFAADTRVPMLFEQNGIRSVTDEISRLEGDYARSRYYGVLLSMGMNFDAPTLVRLVNQAGSEITSDYYMAEVLGKLSSQRYADESVWQAFAAATARMKSDYYKSEAIKKILVNDRLSNTTLSLMLRTAGTIKSDYYQAEILKSVAQRYAVNPQTRQYYIDALRGIESDYYKYEVIKALDAGSPWDDAVLSSILSATAEIKSDYYKSEALLALVRHGRLKTGNRDWYFNVVRTIDADYYKAQAMNELLSERPLSRETVASLLAAAPALKSDHELAGLLTRIARNYRIDSSLRAAYERAANSIDSDYYRGQALAALGRTSSDQ